MSNMRRLFGAALIVVLLGVSIGMPNGLSQAGTGAVQRASRAADNAVLTQQQGTPDEMTVSAPVEPVATGNLADLPLAEPGFKLDREINPRLNFGAQPDKAYNPELGPDPLLKVQEAAAPAAPDAFSTPLLNYNGQGYTFVSPPDTVGEVGPNHYVQMINHSDGSQVTIYNKSTGAVITGPVLLDTLAPTGSACRTGAGDPVILYDQAADRWLLSEFSTNNNYLCVYVSTSNNPGGSYYFYGFQAPVFPDYPKYAVWSDAYYVTTNEGNPAPTPAVYALDRAKMLAGQAATFQRRTAPALSGFGFQALTPVDLDGATAPPAGTPGLFLRHRDTEVHGPSGQPGNDLLELWAFTVNWSTPASSTLTKIADIAVAEFDSALCGLETLNCIQQPGTSIRVDGLREVVMWRLSYRNFGSRQVLVGNFVTDVGNDRAGVRWFELRKTSGNWTLYQEGTYAPGDLSRWMGAIAMDKSGNMALGYNVGNSSTYPGLRYVGRLAGDALGTMPQGEYTIVNGSGSNSNSRYGDYSSMNVDPADDCTFWFTGEWNASGQWSTRIAKFKFDQCGQTPTGTPRAWLPLLYHNTPVTTGTVAGYVTRSNNGQAISGAQVCVLSSSQCANTSAQGYYNIANVGAGNQTVRATASGFTSVQQAVTVFAGATTTANFSLTANAVTRTITHSAAQTVVSDNSISCNLNNIHADNAYLRQFRLTDFGIAGNFNVSSVEFGIEAADAGTAATQPLRVRLYRMTNPGGSLTYNNLTQLASVNLDIPDQALTHYTAPIAGSVPAGSVLVVEVFTPDGTAGNNILFVGSNAAGQTSPTYIAAPDCSVNNPTATADIGFPDMHMVMNVTGTTNALLATPTQMQPAESITVTLGESLTGARFSTHSK
ncbi:MAG: carboxypeptidase-like regulatory domain-containing protein [Anaerolineae bacterium]